MSHPLNAVDFENIERELELQRKAILQNRAVDDSEQVRSLEDGKFILHVVKEIQSDLIETFQKYPSLENAFNKEFGPFREFIRRDVIIEICFIDDYFFPEDEKYPIVFHDCLDKDLIESYITSFAEWSKFKVDSHTGTIEWIKSTFDIERSYKSLPCNCVDCIAEYRTKLRQTVFATCLEEINSTYEFLLEQGDRIDINLVTNRIFEMQRKLEKQQAIIKNKLKRASINKLDKQLKESIRNKFSYTSELGANYSIKIKEYCLKLLEEEGHDSDLVGNEEFDRFFGQLGINIWRNETYIKREFNKLTKSLILLKRKDISSQVLQEYLGEFWIHSQARTLNRKIIYHKGPTNSGKTYHAIQALSQAKKGCYLAPLRLLAAELYDTLNSLNVRTNLLTGEEVIEIEGATHYSSTIEMAKLSEEFDCVVIDEIQMITDKQRGWAWTRAFINIFSPEIHICGDGSVLELIEQIIKLTGDKLEIKEYQRMTQLDIQKNPVTLGDLNKGDALIVFSRRNALKYKRDLESLGFKVSIVYGRLSPEVRREQARKFDIGETDILVSTDAIAMGMNLPIHRVVFSTLTKYIDDKEILISDSEIKQIAGRAGRYKRFPIGLVTCLTRVEDGISIIKNALTVKLPQKKEAMVGPDLEIYKSVNKALEENSLKKLSLPEFLRLFNTMVFKRPFYCVDLSEMIELAEMVEEADTKQSLTSGEIFGFSCAPVNMGLVSHVQYYVWILNNFVNSIPIHYENIDTYSDDIDYLEGSIKCVELFQWLSRHFDNKCFDYSENQLLHNKGEAIERLNGLLSQKLIRYCSSCGVKLPENLDFNICEKCFKSRKFTRRRPRSSSRSEDSKSNKKSQNFRRGRSKNTNRRKGSGIGKRKSGGSRGSKK